MSTAVQQLVEIRLHGFLAARFGRVHHLAVLTAAEALQALSVVCKGFSEAVRDFGGRGFRVRVGDGARAHWRDEVTLAMTIGSATRIDIVPVIHGRKRQGWGQIIVGVILLVAAAYGYGNDATVKLGIQLILGGVIALLSPVPKGSDSKAKQEVSAQISGPPNVTSAGGPVPILIGRMLVGSVVASSGLSTDQVVVETPALDPVELPVDEPDDWFTAPGGDA